MGQVVWKCPRCAREVRSPLRPESDGCVAAGGSGAHEWKRLIELDERFADRLRSRAAGDLRAPR